MILRHKHLPENFINNKTTHKVTQSTPIILLISNKFTFLNDFVIYSLKLNHVVFQVQQTQQQQIMGNKLPAIAFKNYFLSQETLLQFIADLMLQRQSLIDFTQRKIIGKDHYRKWIEIIKQQNTGLCNYKSLHHLGIQTQQDYFNQLFSLFLSMASWIKSDILQRKYQGYHRNQINFQNLLIYQTVNSILKLCQKTKVDHILRANFQNLIDFSGQFKVKIDQVINGEQQDIPVNQIQIISQKQEPQPVVQHKKFYQNWKKFTLVFTIAAGIYIKWVQ